MSFIVRDLPSPPATAPAPPPQRPSPAKDGHKNDSRARPAQHGDHGQQQLQSPFFALLPSEIRIQILSTLLFHSHEGGVGITSQHIVHYHEAGGHLDGFVRVPCRRSPLPSPGDSTGWLQSRHVSEQRNMSRSPWRDGHERCADILQRQMLVRRERHRAAEAAAAVLTLVSPIAAAPMSSQTWSFSPLFSAEGDSRPGRFCGRNKDAGPAHVALSSALAKARLGGRLEEHAAAEEDTLQSPMALLLTCHRLHDETAEILYSSMTFMGLKPLRRFLRQVTSHDYLDHIRHITLQWDATVRLTPVLAHEFDDWGPTCQRLARLRGLATLDVKVFACQRTPTQTRDALLSPLDLVRANARVTAQVVGDCRDPHIDKEFVVIRIGEDQIPIRVCRASANPP
ncbi:hypothetical protein MN608_03871 [Microdochium nivale]|nr:hypothetical protein MN608_03871 [Microdochium nivale]